MAHRKPESTEKPSALQLSAVVLAGGASSRMGQNKALLELDGVPLVERVVDRLGELSDDLLLSTNNFATYAFLENRVRLVPDVAGPGKGPLAGIASALAQARHPRLLVVAADMPFLNVALLHYLASVAPEADIVAPTISADGQPEPLHAIYNKRILPIIEAQLLANHRKVAVLFTLVHARLVPLHEIAPLDPALHSFFNVNTPADWSSAQRIAAAHRAPP